MNSGPRMMLAVGRGAVLVVPADEVGGIEGMVALSLVAEDFAALNASFDPAGTKRLPAPAAEPRDREQRRELGRRRLRGEGPADERPVADGELDQDEDDEAAEREVERRVPPLEAPLGKQAAEGGGERQRGQRDRDRQRPAAVGRPRERRPQEQRVERHAAQPGQHGGGAAGAVSGRSGGASRPRRAYS